MRQYNRHGDYREMGCLELMIAGVIVFLIVAAFASIALQASYF